MTELATLGDAVDALCNPMHVRERYEKWVNRNRKVFYHEHRMPSLLDQLIAAAVPGEVYVEDSGGHVHRAPGSMPPARLEAVNLELTITAWAADKVWLCKLPVREDTAANLRALVGAKVDSDTVAALLVDLRRWVFAARVVAGWQRPPWRPDAPCPACDRKGLRVRLDLSTATCAECGEGWDKDTIGILAKHVAAAVERVIGPALDMVDV